MTTPDTSRVAFERHMLKIGETGLSTIGMGAIARLASGEYEKSITQERWLTWQAAMAHKGADCWQSIETAPKDGTRVLLAAIQDRPLAGTGNWVARHKIWLWPYPLVEPTHWAHLPAVPKQEGST